jgi:hypothetical protein
LVALASTMRLSLRKGAHAGLSSAAWQEIRVRSGLNDKCLGRRGSPFKPNEGLNEAPKALVAGVVSFVILPSTRPSEFGCPG